MVRVTDQCLVLWCTNVAQYRREQDPGLAPAQVDPQHFPEHSPRHDAQHHHLQHGPEHNPKHHPEHSPQYSRGVVTRRKVNIQHTYSVHVHACALYIHANLDSN